MGPSQNKQQQQAPTPTRDPMEIMLDLRMTQKRLENESKKALKEKDKNLQKAKQLKITKREQECLFKQLIKSNKNLRIWARWLKRSNSCKLQSKVPQLINKQINHLKQQMMAQLQQVTPIMAQYTQSMSLENVYSNMTQFDSALDDILVQGKVMDQMMNKDNGDVHSNMQVDMMLQQMKNEERAKMEDMQPQNINQNFQQLQNPQQQQQQQQQQPQKQQQNYQK